MTTNNRQSAWIVPNDLCKIINEYRFLIIIIFKQFIR